MSINFIVAAFFEVLIMLPKRMILFSFILCCDIKLAEYNGRLLVREIES